MNIMTNSQRFSTAARARMAEHCRQTFPLIVPHLSPSSQTEMLKRLEWLARAPEVQSFRPAILRLSDETHRATMALGSTSN